MSFELFDLFLEIHDADLSLAELFACFFKLLLEGSESGLELFYLDIADTYLLFSLIELGGQLGYDDLALADFL